MIFYIHAITKKGREIIKEFPSMKEASIWLENNEIAEIYALGNMMK